MLFVGKFSGNIPFELNSLAICKAVQGLCTYEPQEHRSTTEIANMILLRILHLALNMIGKSLMQPGLFRVQET